MPNNTFIKLFQNQNAAAAENDNKDASGEGDDFKSRNRDHGKSDKNAGRQDELQSIQYVDQNYVESSSGQDSERRSKAATPNRVKIYYNPAKKSRSLGRVGINNKNSHLDPSNVGKDFQFSSGGHGENGGRGFGAVAESSSKKVIRPRIGSMSENKEYDGLPHPGGRRVRQKASS